MSIVAPIQPRLQPQLGVWDGDDSSELEVDDTIMQDADLTGVIRICVTGSRMERVRLSAAVLDKLEFTDVTCAKAEGAGLQAYKSNMLRVVIADSRFTGAEFAEAHVQDGVFKNVKFDDAGFRFAHFTRVRFENCMLRQADFSNAKFEHVVFTGCDLEEANFVSAICKNVDVSTEDLKHTKGILGLRGATISGVQLMQVAPLLAAELGFKVED